MAATAAWLASLEALLNRTLQGSAQTGELTRQLQGTSLEIDVLGVTRIRVAAATHGLDLLAGGDDKADAVIAGSPPALLRLFINGGSPARGAAARAAADRSAAVISGDAEIANRYRRLLELARPDLEEELSRWVGDFAARRAARLARGALDFLRRATGSARENISEYLQEESRDLVNRTELEEFLRGVDGVRDTAERIEARLARLEARLVGAA
jgi:ubiquinone biosynthesis protein UbiJ